MAGTFMDTATVTLGAQGFTRGAITSTVRGMLYRVLLGVWYCNT